MILTTICGIVLTMIGAAPANPNPVPPPAAPAKKVVNKPANNLPEIVPQPVLRPRYSEVYHSIPFSRAEYEANPSYRHEATLELMLKHSRRGYKQPQK